jgi:hypothetical protein
MTQGVVYIASGDRYVEEAVYSAHSLRAHSPQLPIVLFSDRDVADSPFDEVRIVPTRHHRPKVDYLSESPFERTLYLDSDTRVVRPLDEMFALLDRFDMAMAHCFARRRQQYVEKIPEYAAIPYSFPEMNSGVILYAMSAGSKNLFAAWREVYYRYQSVTQGWDQPSLRVALWQTQLALATLPVEYNVRSQGVRDRTWRALRKGGAPDAMLPRVLHWHGLNSPQWWHRFSPKYRQYKF